MGVQARWQALRLDRWPSPHLHLDEVKLRTPSGDWQAARIDLSLELAPLLLRRDLRVETITLVDARWQTKDLAVGLPSRIQQLLPDLRRVQILRGQWTLPQGTIFQVFLDLRRSRGSVQWEARGKIGRGEIRSFGLWRVNERGHGKISLERVPAKLFPAIQAALPPNAWLDGSFVLRRLSGWYARGELEVHNERGRWARLRLRLQSTPDGRIDLREAFVHFAKGNARATGSCDQSGICRFSLQAHNAPASLWKALWPAQALAPERIEGTMDLDLALEKAKGWRIEGEIRPHGVRFVRRDASSPLPDAPIALRWQRNQLQLAWRNEGEGSLFWQRKDSGFELALRLQGKAWQGWLSDWLQAALGIQLTGRGTIKLTAHLLQGQEKLRALRLHFDARRAELTLHLPQGVELAKPTDAPARLVLEAKRNAKTWRIRAETLQWPGIELAGLRLRWNDQEGVMRVLRLKFDAAGLAATRLERLAWGGLLEGAGALRWRHGQLVAVDGTWRLQRFRWKDWLWDGEVRGDGVRFYAQRLSFASPGLSATLRFRADARKRYARIDLLHWHLDANLPWDAWRKRLRRWRNWRFDGLLARGTIEAGKLSWNRAHGEWRWNGTEIELPSLQMRAAGGRVALRHCILRPTKKGWQFDGKLHITGLRLEQWEALRKPWQLATLSGKAELRLWLRGNWPPDLAQWRSSGDLAIYGLRLARNGFRDRLKKLEARIRFDGESLELNPIVWLGKRSLRGWLRLSRTGLLQGGLVEDRSKRVYLLSGRWNEPVIR